MADARDDICSEIAVHVAMWTPWGNVPELAERPGIVVKVPTGGGPMDPRCRESGRTQRSIDGDREIRREGVCPDIKEENWRFPPLRIGTFSLACPVFWNVFRAGPIKQTPTFPGAVDMNSPKMKHSVAGCTDPE
jgi:hypothetical protein